MEHIFKLKKGGKTVGYLCIKDGCVSTCSDPWDTAYLFVTQDKHGKDVFAGDRVKSGKRILTIVWDKDYMQWRAGEEDNPYFAPLCQWAISEQFELIEDTKDD